MNIDRESSSPFRPLASSLSISGALIAVLIRLVPHPPNLTPVGALGIYSGARLRWWQALAIPLVVMAVSDLLLWAVWDKRPFDPFVYASFVLSVPLGRLLRRSESPWRIGGVSLLASLLFFLVTNFGNWLMYIGRPDALYSPDLRGLLTCYTMAIPFFGTQAPPLGFFGNTVLGDLSFTVALFGAHALLTRTVFPAERVPVLAR
jgi:hypothetical protein